MGRWNMPSRSLYVAAYDIADAKRLRRVLAILKEYSTGGQKSVFECFLTDGEKIDLLARVCGELCEREDKFLLLRLDPRGEIRVYGRAVRPENPRYFVVG